MSKGRGRNGMLGVGGQRKKLSRRELRGGRAQTAGTATDPAAEKQALLQKMRKRTEERTDQRIEQGAEQRGEGRAEQRRGDSERGA